MKVLLIENQPAEAELVQRALRKYAAYPCEVEWVQTLGLGLDRLKNGGIDVVLLDLGLSDSQGLDSVKRVRAKALHVPIVVLTGSYADESMAVEALKQGAQDYLMKDQLDGKILSRALRYAIERKQAEEALHQKIKELAGANETLEKFNKLAAGREQRMIELKAQVNEISKALGRPEPYDLSFTRAKPMEGLDE